MRAGLLIPLPFSDLKVLEIGSELRPSTNYTVIYEGIEGIEFLGLIFPTNSGEL